MPSREELLATEAKLRALLASGAEVRLRSIPGVTHVSVGVKERDHLATGTMGIRVYVREKRPLDQLSPGERIPDEIDGVPTDVIVSRTFRHALDVTRYRPVEGGATITNRIIGVNKNGMDTGMSFGTFGCTATLTSDGSAVLLSNYHVLMAHGGKKGDYIYQPGPSVWDHVPVEDAPVRPHDDTDMIAKIAKGVLDPHVDAAVARLDVSSCCHCCGIEYRDEIIALSEDGMPPSNKILGLRAAVSNTTVYKVGAVSGRTSGTVMDTKGDPITISFNGVDTTFVEQIYIAGDDGLFTFSNEGDSGSAIIDEDGYIVGLLFASTDDPPPVFRASANHIEDVQSALGITINLTKHTTPSSGRRLAPSPRVTYPEIRGGPEIYARARAQLMRDPAGAWLWALAEEHREEVVRLVTTCRPVTVAWRRAGGPAFFAAGLNTIRAGGNELPIQVNGLSLEAALDRVGQSLAAHGSPPLRAAIEEHRNAILQSVRGSATLQDVLEKLHTVLA
jgi:hypothetical protein